MMSSSRVFLVVAALSVAAVLLIWLQPRVEQRLAPTPKSAWVGIEIADSGVAVVGPAKMEAGTPFRLHAILEAETQSGEVIFYTEADRVEIRGEPVAGDRLRGWDQAAEAKILWFTVEGFSPFVELEPGLALQQNTYGEFFHPDWSTRWSVEGRLDPRFDDQIEGEYDRTVPFGTQRYQVWVELWEDPDALVAKQRFKSWGASDLVSHADDFPAVTAFLPDAPAASSVFGLTQVEAPAEVASELGEEIARRSRQRILFSRLLLLREILERAESPVAELTWERIDLEAGPSWNGGVRAGDLIQVGTRFVVLYKDAGRPGVLDGDDLCFDYESGAAIRRLAEVFSGEGEVDLARLSGGADR